MIVKPEKNRGFSSPDKRDKTWKGPKEYCDRKGYQDVFLSPIKRRSGLFSLDRENLLEPLGRVFSPHIPFHEEKQDAEHGHKDEKSNDHPLKKGDLVIDQSLQHPDSNKIGGASDGCADSSDRCGISQSQK